MTDGMKGMDEAGAVWLRDRLVPLLPDNDLSAAPWSSEDGEWIVTVWDREGVEALIDIKNLEPGYLVRQVGTRRVLARVARVEDIPGAIQ